MQNALPTFFFSCFIINSFLPGKIKEKKNGLVLGRQEDEDADLIYFLQENWQITAFSNSGYSQLTFSI